MAMKETVLITGASAGIGEALAKEFAAHGHDLVLAARRAEPMEELAEHVRSAHGVEAQVVALDVTHPDAVEQLRTALGDKQVSILVNNAGVLSSGWFVRMDGDDIESMLTLNIVALTR
ncbi:MAG: SDR family NAD(P)-dependent oxidoreductase, partial [Pseudomonadota bacterium]